MPVTIRGIYHNLKESKYVISNTEITFFFSSTVYLEKYMNGYEENREKFLSKLEKIVVENPLNMSILADISYYKEIEKRGFYVWLKGVEISCEELHRYALRKMTEKNSLDWQKTQKPKLHERIRIME
jgi:polyhydroxyalkanoate synthesis regulator protein